MTLAERIAILHYASPPTVGGVESTIAYHARGLVAQGYAVRVVSGAGETFDSRIETHINPLFGSKHPEILKVKSELDSGVVSPAFEALVERLVIDLRAALADCDVCIVHNVHSLNKNLPLTAALARLKGTCRFLAWCHDLAWTNPQYQPELYEGYPWDLLRQAWPETRYVTVSEARRGELADLLGISTKQIAAVVPGVDPATFFHWTPITVQLVDKLNLLDADGLLLIPARLTRRKNIGLGLKILAAVRQASGKDFRLIVTGPPGPHNPANPGYLQELLNLRTALGLEKYAHFLYAYGEGEQPLIPDDGTMANLYQLADALLFPTMQEGFGIPMVEAGLVGLPIFCADIPPLRNTGQEDVTYFDPVQGSPEQIAAQIWEKLQGYPPYRLKVRVRHDYRWDAIIRQQIIPLIEEGV